MARINDYGTTVDPKHAGELELHPGDHVRLKSTSKHAHLTDTERLGRVEKVEGRRITTRLKHATFVLDRSEILKRGITE